MTLRNTRREKILRAQVLFFDSRLLREMIVPICAGRVRPAQRAGNSGAVCIDVVDARGCSLTSEDVPMLAHQCGQTSRTAKTFAGQTLREEIIKK